MKEGIKMIYINKEKLKQIQEEDFYIVTDFDRTITSFQSVDSWDASGKILEEEFTKKSKQLYEKYAPIELDYTISIEEKNEAMKKWYEECMDNYYKYNLTEEKLNKSIESSKLEFRKGAKEFLEQANKNNVPVIILSAGIGNVIKKFLKDNKCYYENIFIISNFIEFDTNGDMIKFDNNKIIHTLNKTLENNLPKQWQEKIAQKRNALLFGDLVYDLNMLPKEKREEAITFGFLRDTGKIEDFTSNFDITLIKEDGNFDKVKEILNKEIFHTNI